MPADAPKVGDNVYVPQTDVVHKTFLEGGLGVVTDTWKESGRLFLSVAELPDASFAWDFLAGQQDALKQRYGESRAGQYMLGPEQPFDEP